jgi:hypothetical protein
MAYNDTSANNCTWNCAAQSKDRNYSFSLGKCCTANKEHIESGRSTYNDCKDLYVWWMEVEW